MALEKRVKYEKSMFMAGVENKKSNGVAVILHNIRSAYNVKKITTDVVYGYEGLLPLKSFNYFSPVGE